MRRPQCRCAPREEGFRGRVGGAGHTATNTRVAIRDLRTFYSGRPSCRTLAGDLRAGVNGSVGFLPPARQAVDSFAFSEFDEQGPGGRMT